MFARVAAALRQQALRPLRQRVAIEVTLVKKLFESARPDAAATGPGRAGVGGAAASRGARHGGIPSVDAQAEGSPRDDRRDRPRHARGWTRTRSSRLAASAWSNAYVRAANAVSWRSFPRGWRRALDEGMTVAKDIRCPMVVGNLLAAFHAGGLLGERSKATGKRPSTVPSRSPAPPGLFSGARTSPVKTF